uniref:GAG-pre-integrase domain-containing protein n=1 Tax=Cajanus cajan TaxID=3821 RepID=A0A151S1Y1_CAJCA|nr:hypothetical protein KK1_029478 [Cajanus cajan]
MALHDDFEGLRGTILHHSPLPSVDVMVKELLAKEIQLKSSSGSDKGILSTPPSVFATPFNKSNSHGKVGYDECSYCLYSSSSSGMSSPIWVLDYGASHHMSYDPKCFMSLNTLILSYVYYIPSLTLNLVSVGQLCDSSYSVLRLVGIGRKQGRLYMFDELKVPNVVASIVDLSSFNLNSASSSFYLWHSRLGHVSSSRLKYLASTRALGKLQTSDIFYCCGCKLAKFIALPFSKSVSISQAPLT